MELEYYGGDGFGGCKEDALYQVKWGDDKHKYFGKFSKAKKFYDGLNEPKAFWNNDTMELLDCYVYKDSNENKLVD